MCVCVCLCTPPQHNCVHLSKLCAYFSYTSRRGMCDLYTLQQQISMDITHTHTDPALQSHTKNGLERSHYRHETDGPNHDTIYFFLCVVGCLMHSQEELGADQSQISHDGCRAVLLLVDGRWSRSLCGHCLCVVKWDHKERDCTMCIAVALLLLPQGK